jgi:putative ABC transport system ATP-binding protein
VSVTPQRFGLFPELTVRESVEYPARLAGRLGECADWIDELLELLALDDLTRRFPSELSIGQQQRTALARALVLRPRLVLADEPTGHQDTGSALAVLEALRRVTDAGSACLIATHDEEVASHCDSVHTMASGRLLEPAPA